jgi:hypothetical protein
MSSINKLKLTPLNSAIRGFGVALLLSSQQAYSQTFAPPETVEIQPMERVNFEQIMGAGPEPVCADQYTNLINGLNEQGSTAAALLNVAEIQNAVAEDTEWAAMAAGFTALSTGLETVAASGAVQSAGAAAADAGTIALGVMLGEYTGAMTLGGGGLTEAAAGVVVPLDAGLAAPGLGVTAGSMYSMGVAAAAAAAVVVEQATATAAWSAAIGTGAAGAAAAGVGAAAAATQSVAMAAVTTRAIVELTAATVGNAAVSSANRFASISGELPACDTTFAGTATVSAGGLEVTGNSIFHDDLGVEGNISVVGRLGVQGTFTANQISAAQNVSADGNRITLGGPGNTFEAGITLGGGNMSGAGYSSDPAAQAFTNDVTAIAIGNGSSATAAGASAFGEGANATQIGATALGANAQATGDSALASGQEASASNSATTAVGQSSLASGISASAFGQGAQATGGSALASGQGALASGSNSAAVGS